MTVRAPRAIGVALLAAIAVLGCGDDDVVPGTDAGVRMDAGGGTTDSGARDGGVAADAALRDAGDAVDAGVSSDAGDAVDAGSSSDAGSVDSGGSADAGSPVDAGGPAADGGLLGLGAVCSGGGSCGPGLTCCYPCGIPGCDDICEVTCTAGTPGCFGGCFLRP